MPVGQDVTSWLRRFRSSPSSLPTPEPVPRSSLPAYQGRRKGERCTSEPLLHRSARRTRHTAPSRSPCAARIISVRYAARTAKGSLGKRRRNADPRSRIRLVGPPSLPLLHGPAPPCRRNQIPCRPTQRPIGDPGAFASPCGNREQGDAGRQEKCRSELDLRNLQSAANSPDRRQQKEKQAEPRKRLHAEPCQAKQAGRKR